MLDPLAVWSGVLLTKAAYTSNEYGALLKCSIFGTFLAGNG
jgi:hypothetical protein